MSFHTPDAPYVLQDAAPRDDETILARDESFLRTLTGGLRRGGWKWPIGLFVLAFAVFSLTSWDRLTKPSADPHFAYLAETYNTMIAAALGNGEAQSERAELEPFELARKPPHRNDWASYWDITLEGGDRYRGFWLDQQGHGRFKTLDNKAVMLDRSQLTGAERKRRYFVSFPPAPAVMMMPFVALTGVEFNDVVFTIVFASFNVLLMFLLLRRLSRGGRSGRGRSANIWLTLLFGFGTAHFWCSVLGQVWFTALILGVTFTLLYIHAAIDARHPVWAGIFCALAFATRTPLVFSAIFFYAFVFFPGGKLRRDDWVDALRKIALFSTPCLIVGLSLLGQNHIRFESLTEFGHTYLAAGSLERIQTYGLFNAQFLSKNLSAAFTLIPRFQPDAPYVIISKHGMSIFLTTPAFFYLFRPEKRECVRDRFWFALLWITVAMISIPALFYQNTGYEQFGYRFVLDYTPYLILLLAVGRHPITLLFKASVLVSIAVNAFGAATFKRVGKFYSNKFFV